MNLDFIFKQHVGKKTPADIAGTYKKNVHHVSPSLKVINQSWVCRGLIYPPGLWRIHHAPLTPF
jgi:hypothetical protein